MCPPPRTKNVRERRLFGEHRRLFGIRRDELAEYAVIGSPGIWKSPFGFSTPPWQRAGNPVVYKTTGIPPYRGNWIGRGGLVLDIYFFAPTLGQ